MNADSIKGTLASLHKGGSARIDGLNPASGNDEAATLLRLVELGFVQGERVRVIAKAFPGGYPMAVRIGNTTFALRCHEASLIRIAALENAPEAAAALSPAG